MHEDATRAVEREAVADPAAGSHAVVVGGSMAGLLAARVLADHFARVTVVDRDRFPCLPDHRAGAPQSHHAHALLQRGQQILGGLFPGIVADLLAAGATPALRPPVIVSPVGKLATAPPPKDAAAPAGRTGPAPGVYASRILLEWHVRGRLGGFPGITIRPATEVVGLAAGAGGRAAGVRVRPRGAADEPAVETLAADLVVDASGRQSAAPAWLEELGYGPTPEEVVHSDIGYASRFYRKPEGWPGEWDGIIVNGRVPHNPRAGLILPIEDGLWHVSLGGFAGHYPPTDEEGFLDWARGLPDPSLYEAIRVAEPVTPIRGYRTPQNRLRRFDQLARWPEGFVTLGDAVCAFNPIYGQGMTVAAVEADLLGRALAARGGAGSPGFARRFQRDLAKAVADPWLIASGEDLRWEVEASGIRPRRGSGLVRGYVERVLRRARTDPRVAGAYMAVVSMAAPPSSLFAPRVLLPTAAGALAERLGRGDEPADEWALSPAAIARLRSLRPFGAAVGMEAAR
jgi:2-polyprenyl-6-methoxyphenol hydroxylase-like FAD-dependent oxidoreductase